MVCAAGCSAEARKSRSLKRAEDYFAAGEYEKAKIEYLNVRKIQPQHPGALVRLGQIWWEQGSPLRAHYYLVPAQEVAPADVENRLRLAQALVAMGSLDNLDKARQEAARILKQDSRHGKAIQLLAEIVPNEEAIKAEEAAIKTRNADKAIDNVTKERVEKARKALDDTRAALNRFPDKETAAFYLAKTHFAIRQRDLASAMKEVKSALEADPKSVDAHILRGRLLFAETAKATDAEATKAEATKEFKTAADLSPPRSTAKLRYAEFLVQQGSSDQARTFLKEVTQKAPDNVQPGTLSPDSICGRRNSTTR